MSDESPLEPLLIPGVIIIPPRRHEDERLGFAMTKSEWKRLRRKAQKIQPVVPWWSISGALFAGGALTCAINFLLLFLTPSSDKLGVITNGLLALALIAIATVCLISDASQRRRVTEDALELLAEMDVIERGHPDTFQTVGTDPC